MVYNRSHARNLCSASEYALVEASFGGELEHQSAAQLQKKIERTRKLRDKQRDLLQRQRLATRARTGTKGGKTGGDNRRTEQKAQLFTEALERFEARLAALERAVGGAAPRRRSRPGKREKGRSARRERSSARQDLRRATKRARGGAAAAAPAARAGREKASKQGEQATQKLGKKARKSSEERAPRGRSDTGASVPPARPARAEPGVQPEAKKRRFVSPEAKSAIRRQQPEQARQRSIQAHISSRGRRNQARRDSR